MKQATPIFSAIACAAALLAAAPALGQTDQPVSQLNPDTKSTADGYWTAERFKAAKPLPLPHPGPGVIYNAPAGEKGAARPESRDGKPPSTRTRPAGQQLYRPEPARQRSAQTVEPQATGTAGGPYTSTRVFPMFTGDNARFSADRAYPHTTVGKLFFSINGSPYVCSGAVIQQRVVATAGHCVHSGTSSGFYSNFVFVPAFRDGEAPLKIWNWRYVTTTGTWANGGGSVPNAADYAMIEFADQAMTSGGALTKIGTVTGWLGWQTLSLDANHTSKLGYPCNLDACQKMQNVTSNSLRTSFPNNVEYGTDARGGSSGGPWVQNFATVAAGGGTGFNTGPNRVVGVASYGYVSEEPKAQGASILDSRWVQLWNLICARSGNCG